MAGCACPISASLETIVDNSCPVQWDRVQKLSLSREKKFWSTTSDDVSTVIELQTLSEWSESLGLSDNFKALITPKIGNFIIVPGEALTQEFDGDVKSTGSYAPSQVTLDFHGASSAQLSSLRKLTCEPSLYAMFFDKDGNIVHGVDATGIPTGLRIAIQTWTVTDQGQEEAGGLIISHATFQLVDGWSVGTELTVTEPTDFNPLIDLTN